MGSVQALRPEGACVSIGYHSEQSVEVYGFFPKLMTVLCVESVAIKPNGSRRDDVMLGDSEYYAKVHETRRHEILGPVRFRLPLRMDKTC